MIRSFALFTLTAGLVACGDARWPDLVLAPDAAEVLAPETVALRWDSSFNGVDDGVGALIPVDVMVYGGRSGRPFVAADVTLEPYTGVVWVLTADEVYADSGTSLTWDAWRGEYIALPDLFLDEPVGVTDRTDEDGLVRMYLYVDAFSADDNGDLLDAAVTISAGGRDAHLLLTPQ